MDIFSISADLLPFLAKVASGAFVGLMVGLTGVGGGSLMTPMLTLLLGVPPVIAVGTDLAFACVTKSVGILAHRTSNLIQWDIVKLLLIGSIPSAIFTILLLKQTDYHQFDYLIRTLIALSVSLTLFGLIFRQKMLDTISRWKNWPLAKKPLTIATILIGAIIGLLVTLTSIGAGVIGVVAILLLYPHIRPAQLAATDITYAVPITATAAIGHIWLGTVNWQLLLILLIGSIPGIWCGAKLSKRLPDRAIRGTLMAILAYVAFKMIYI